MNSDFRVLFLFASILLLDSLSARDLSRDYWDGDLVVERAWQHPGSYMILLEVAVWMADGAPEQDSPLLPEKSGSLNFNAPRAGLYWGFPDSKRFEKLPSNHGNIIRTHIRGQPVDYQGIRLQSLHSALGWEQEQLGKAVYLDPVNGEESKGVLSLLHHSGTLFTPVDTRPFLGVELETPGAPNLAGRFVIDAVLIDPQRGDFIVVDSRLDESEKKDSSKGRVLEMIASRDPDPLRVYEVKAFGKRNSVLFSYQKMDPSYEETVEGIYTIQGDRLVVVSDFRGNYGAYRDPHGEHRYLKKRHPNFRDYPEPVLKELYSAGFDINGLYPLMTHPATCAFLLKLGVW